MGREKGGGMPSRTVSSLSFSRGKCSSEGESTVSTSARHNESPRLVNASSQIHPNKSEATASRNRRHFRAVRDARPPSLCGRMWVG